MLFSLHLIAAQECQITEHGGLVLKQETICKPIIAGQQVPNANCMNLSQTAPEILRKMCTPGAQPVNKPLMAKIDPSMGTLQTVLSKNPDASAQFEALMNSYGVMDPPSASSPFSMKLPDPQVLVKSIEEATAMHLTFKKYLQELLEKIKKYLQRSALALSEITLDIKTKFKELRREMKQHENEVSQRLKGIMARDILKLKEDLQADIEEFERIKKWQMTLTNSISTNL